MKLTIKTIVWPLIAFFAPVKEIIILMICMIFIDTITGIWKSVKLGVPITSRMLSRIISKLILYCGGVLLVYGVDSLLMNDILMRFFTVDLLMTKVVAMIFAFIELISINENWKAVKGFDIWEKFKELTKRAKTIKEEITDLNIDKIKKQ